jgi:hypothetical protein
VQEFIDQHAALSEASTRHILSLCLDDTRPESLYLPLRLVQHLDFSPRIREEAKRKILAQLKSTPEPPSAIGEGTTKKPQRRAPMIVAGVCVLFVAVAMALWRPGGRDDNKEDKNASNESTVTALASAGPPIAGGPPAGLIVFPEAPPPGKAPTSHPALRLAEHEFVLVDTRPDATGAVVTLRPPSFYLTSRELQLGEFNAFLTHTGQQPRPLSTSVSPQAATNVDLATVALFDGYATPVTDVDRASMRDYCEYLNGLEESPGQFRLPTIGEWEFAGAELMPKLQFSQLTAGDPPLAWLAENSKALRPTGQTRATRLGIYDLFGNASEFVTVDADHQYRELEGDRQAAVGGSWRTKQSELQAISGRISRLAKGQADDLGFRVAMTAADRPILVSFVNKTKYDIELQFYSDESHEWYGYGMSAGATEEKPGVMPGWNWCDVIRDGTVERQRIGRRYMGFAPKAWATLENKGTTEAPKLDLTVLHFATDRVDGGSDGAAK